MIQRKQTVFLLLALVAVVVCLMMPVGAYEPAGVGAYSEISNWFLHNTSTGRTQWTPFSLMLLLTCPFTLWAIFAYNKRKLQARLCVVNMMLVLLWYAIYTFYYVITPDGMTFHIFFAACLPLVAFILFVMARVGVKADEKLLRDADRIR